MKISTILVDFNGTLSPGNFGRTFALYKDRTNGLGKEIIHQYVSKGLLVKLFNGEINRTEFWLEVSQITDVNLDILMEIEQHIISTKAIDQDFLDQIRKLRKIYKVALATDNSSEWIDQWDDRFKLNHEFDGIFVSATIGFTKAQSEYYTLISETLETELEDCLLIDDDENVIKFASSLGIKTLKFENTAKLINDIQAYTI